MGSDDTGAWFERRLREPSFVIPEIGDFRRQRGTAREREGAFGDAAITDEVRYSLVTTHYLVGAGTDVTGNTHRFVASSALSSDSLASSRLEAYRPTRRSFRTCGIL